LWILWELLRILEHTYKASVLVGRRYDREVAKMRMSFDIVQGMSIMIIGNTGIHDPSHANYVTERMGTITNILKEIIQRLGDCTPAAPVAAIGERNRW